MSSERELDEGIKSIKSAWRRERTARANLEKMLQQAEAENAKLRDENTELRKLGGFMLRCISQYHDCTDCLVNGEHCEISYIEADVRELGVTA